MITFGGTDPNNYTLKILKIINGLGLENIKVNIILGLGYKNKESLLQFIKNKNLNVLIKQDVKNISKYMHLCDLIFTSAGRTVYEIASIGTPTIILCQNERELHHTFAIKENGLINLGLGYKLSDKKIEETILNVIYNNKLRVELNKKMLKNNLKLGASNVISLIYSHYEQFKSEVLS
ncbi:MAG: glycosyltransferase [Candidatus Lokiarchaeota archaeon]